MFRDATFLICHSVVVEAREDLSCHFSLHFFAEMLVLQMNMATSLNMLSFPNVTRSVTLLASPLQISVLCEFINYCL